MLIIAGERVKVEKQPLFFRSEWGWENPRLESAQTHGLVLFWLSHCGLHDTSHKWILIVNEGFCWLFIIYCQFPSWLVIVHFQVFICASCYVCVDKRRMLMSRKLIGRVPPAESPRTWVTSMIESRSNWCSPYLPTWCKISFASDASRSDYKRKFWYHSIKNL